jgi:hypothetical protein
MKKNVYPTQTTKPVLVLPRLTARATFQPSKKTVKEKKSKNVFESKSYYLPSLYSNSKSVLFSSSRSLINFDFVLQTASSTANLSTASYKQLTASLVKPQSLPLILQKSGQFYLKKFRFLGNMARFCVYWAKWASQNYNSRIDEFISFVQIAKMVPDVAESFFLGKIESQEIRDKIEMLNFDVGFYKSTKRVDREFDSKAKSILLDGNFDGRSKQDLFLIRY